MHDVGRRQVRPSRPVAAHPNRDEEASWRKSLIQSPLYEDDFPFPDLYNREIPIKIFLRKIGIFISM